MKQIFPGTTPTLSFTLPFDPALLAEAWITLQQSATDTITKTLSDCEIDKNKLSFTLTQEETLKLIPNAQILIQMRVRFADGSAAASRVIRVDAAYILTGGVI